MSLLALRNLEAKGIYPTGLDWAESRRCDYGFIAATMKGADRLINPATRQIIENSWGTVDIKIPVRDDGNITATAGCLTCAFPNAQGTFSYYNITFVCAKTGFTVIPALSDQTAGVVSEATDFLYQFMDHEEALADFVESTIQSTLDTNKATAFNSPIVGATAKYPILNDALQVSAANQPLFYNDMKAIMRADKFRPNYCVIGDPYVEALWNNYINQGAGNAQNSQFQFNGFEPVFSNSITTTAGAVATAYVMPIGSLALFSRVSPEARRGSVATESGIRWSVEPSELMGIDMELMQQTCCDDVSALTGNPDDTARLVKKYQMGINFAVVTPYVTQPNGPIKKVDWLA